MFRIYLSFQFTDAVLEIANAVAVLGHAQLAFS